MGSTWVTIYIAFFLITVGGKDYIPIEQTLVTFSAESSSPICFSIDIFPDNITESRESFLVLANSSDSSVNIIVDSIKVIIIDDDSKLYD